MAKSNLRLLAMLRLIPREPRRISTAELKERLEEEGFATTQRSVQRDLNTLSELFQLVCDTRSTPYGWSWSAAAAAQSLPGMDPATALTFWLAREHLAKMLPIGVLNLMEPHFEQARRILDTNGNGLSAWRNKIRVLPRTQQLRAPHVEPAITATVYEALLRGQKLSVRYKPANGETRDYLLNPHGLAVNDTVVYLVASHRDYDSVVMFALQRFESAERLEEAAQLVEGFDIDEWVRLGGYFSNPENPTIRLVALLELQVAYHLYETPLSDDQILAPTEDGKVRLSAVVANTRQLQWWLNGFGDEIEVLEPLELREGMRRTVRNLSERYGSEM